MYNKKGDDMKEKQLDALLENINYEISLLSNMSAFIKQEFKDVSWAGFYLNQDEQLILGPFQGLVAWTIIPFDKGVCGACAKNLTTLRVANVHEFSGHIALKKNKKQLNDTENSIV